MDRDVLRQAAVVAGVLGGMVSGVTGDHGDGAESDSRVLPADWAFGVWSPVYAGSLAYAAETARPSRRRGPSCRSWPRRRPPTPSAGARSSTAATVGPPRTSPRNRSPGVRPA
ncbi:hypothetical protein [Geodermatophilus sp. SYSU D01036]